MTPSTRQSQSALRDSGSKPVEGVAKYLYREIGLHLWCFECEAI